MKNKTLAIIGASGLVGQTFIKILQEENVTHYNLKLFASNKSANKTLLFNGKYIEINPLDENSFDDVDYAMFFTSEDISKIFIPLAQKKNVVVIDNSSAFRMDENVKLIAYGVNEQTIDKNDTLISNPNCCCIQSVRVINKLINYGIKRIIYNTYQSVSGSGKQGIDDLLRCRKGLMPLFYDTDISFTCIPKIGDYLDNDFTTEEEKLMLETKKILNNYDIEALATCVRVPVMFSHGISIQLDLLNDFSLQDIIRELKSDPNIVVCENIIPSGVLSCKNDKIYVGRIRKIGNTLMLYCVADNVRVGAATNALYILHHIASLRGDDYK